MFSLLNERCILTATLEQPCQATTNLLLSLPIKTSVSLLDAASVEFLTPPLLSLSRRKCDMSSDLDTSTDYYFNNLFSHEFFNSFGPCLYFDKDVSN